MLNFLRDTAKAPLTRPSTQTKVAPKAVENDTVDVPYNSAILSHFGVAKAAAAPQSPSVPLPSLLAKGMKSGQMEKAPNEGKPQTTAAAVAVGDDGLNDSREGVATGSVNAPNRASRYAVSSEKRGADDRPASPYVLPQPNSNIPVSSLREVLAIEADAKALKEAAMAELQAELDTEAAVEARKLSEQREVDDYFQQLFDVLALEERSQRNNLFVENRSILLMVMREWHTLLQKYKERHPERFSYEGGYLKPNRLSIVRAGGPTTAADAVIQQREDAIAAASRPGTSATACSSQKRIFFEGEGTAVINDAVDRPVSPSRSTAAGRFVQVNATTGRTTYSDYDATTSVYRAPANLKERTQYSYKQQVPPGLETFTAGDMDLDFDLKKFLASPESFVAKRIGAKRTVTLYGDEDVTVLVEGAGDTTTAGKQLVLPAGGFADDEEPIVDPDAEGNNDSDREDYELSDLEMLKRDIMFGDKATRMARKQADWELYERRSRELRRRLAEQEEEAAKAMALAAGEGEATADDSDNLEQDPNNTADEPKSREQPPPHIIQPNFAPSALSVLVACPADRELADEEADPLDNPKSPESMRRERATRAAMQLSAPRDRPGYQAALDAAEREMKKRRPDANPDVPGNYKHYDYESFNVEAYIASTTLANANQFSLAAADTFDTIESGTVARPLSGNPAQALQRLRVPSRKYYTRQTRRANREADEALLRSIEELTAQAQVEDEAIRAEEASQRRILEALGLERQLLTKERIRQLEWARYLGSQQNVVSSEELFMRATYWQEERATRYNLYHWFDDNFEDEVERIRLRMQRDDSEVDRKMAHRKALADAEAQQEYERVSKRNQTIAFDQNQRVLQLRRNRIERERLMNEEYADRMFILRAEIDNFHSPHYCDGDDRGFGEVKELGFDAIRIGIFFPFFLEKILEEQHVLKAQMTKTLSRVTPYDISKAVGNERNASFEVSEQEKDRNSRVASAKNKSNSKRYVDEVDPEDVDAATAAKKANNNEDDDAVDTAKPSPRDPPAAADEETAAEAPTADVSPIKKLPPPAEVDPNDPKYDLSMYEGIEYDSEGNVISEAAKAAAKDKANYQQFMAMVDDEPSTLTTKQATKVAAVAAVEDAIENASASVIPEEDDDEGKRVVLHTPPPSKEQVVDTSAAKEQGEDGPEEADNPVTKEGANAIDETNGCVAAHEWTNDRNDESAGAGGDEAQQ